MLIIGAKAGYIALTSSQVTLRPQGEGARAVLEVRSHEVPFILEDGQIIGRLVYEPLTEAPERVYGEAIGSNYQRQGQKLSKHFKPFDSSRR